MSKAERTRAFIIERTAPIFNKQGFAGTSLNDITAATGLTKGSIYGNFANKDEVALAVFDYNLKKLNDAVGMQFAKQSCFKNKLLVYADHYEQIFNPPFTEGGCAILNTAIEADDTHPELRKKAAEAVLCWKNKLVQLIDEGVANKEFKTKVDATQLAFTMIAMVEGGIMISKLLGDEKHMGTVMKSMKKMIQDL